MLQTITVILIIALAVGYATGRIWRSFSSNDDPCAHCAGCSLKDSVNGKARQLNRLDSQGNPTCQQFVRKR